MSGPLVQAESTKDKMPSNSTYHQVWLDAHYALGKHESAIGHTLSDKERSTFLKEFIAEYNTANPGKIEQ